MSENVDIIATEMTTFGRMHILVRASS